MKHIAILLYLLFFPILAHSQELRKMIKKNENSSIYEEYFVLKEDQTMKHGVYIKYLERLFVQKYICEFGNFDHDKKTGTWCLFNITHPQNPLNIVGEYSNGVKNGQWLYFYPPEIKDASVLTLLGNNKLTSVIEPKGKNQQYQVAIDTTGIKLAASGNYENNKKSGVWSYYSKDGRLSKEYDFSNNKIIYSSQNDSVSFHMLGGIYQFERQLSQVFIENNNKLKSFHLSNLKLEIITNENRVFVNNLTTTINDPFSEFIEDRIKNMPLDWIDFDPVFEKMSFVITLNFRNEEADSSVKIESSRPKFNNDFK